MIFHNLVAQAQDRLAKRRRYQQLVGEIQNLSERDLSDIRGDRHDMLRAAYRQVYG